MVNHSLAELRNFCQRGIWLADGQMVMDGPIGDVIEAYEKS